MSRQCEIEGCNRPHYAHGWCRRHFDRWRRAGDPVAPDRRASFDPLSAGFWSHVDSSGGPEACWRWLHAPTSHGYGSVRRQGRTFMAHRVAYELGVGPFDEALYVLHRCDNRLCCNPAHLFLGTHADNMEDMAAKGRGRGGNEGGEGNHAARLTAEQVEEIRSRYPGETQRALAREYGVTQSQVSRIVTRKRWAGPA